jgi:hypothetical protein
MKAYAVVMLAGLAACGGSSSSRPNDRPDPNQPTIVTPFMLQPPPVYALLGFRDRLSLSSQQITSLDSIATSVHEENQPLIDELQQNAQQSRNRVGLLVSPDSRPTLQKIRQNNRDAARAVGELLNPQQQTTACDLFNEERDDRRSRVRDAMRERGMGETSQRQREMRRRLEGDSTLQMEVRVWPWCTVQANDENG